MTAINTRPVRETRDNVAAAAAPGDSLLRFALRADATLCAGLGLLVAMAADPLSRLSGLSSTSECAVSRDSLMTGPEPPSLEVAASAPEPVVNHRKGIHVRHHN